MYSFNFIHLLIQNLYKFVMVCVLSYDFLGAANRENWAISWMDLWHDRAGPINPAKWPKSNYKLVWCSVESALAELAQLHTACAEETWEQTLSICCKRVGIWCVCYDRKIECVPKEREREGGRESEGGRDGIPAPPLHRLYTYRVHFEPCHPKRKPQCRQDASYSGQKRVPCCKAK